MSHSVTPPIVCQSLGGDPRIQLLQYQLQRGLRQQSAPSLTVRADHPIDWLTPMPGDPSDAYQPSIAVLAPLVESGGPHPAQTSDGLLVRWVMDVMGKADEEATETALNAPLNEAPETDSSDDLRAGLYARRAIASYWLLHSDRAELKLYTEPTASGYGKCQLLHVGESATPEGLPGIVLRLQEPVPLYFLTRTLRGQRSYASFALPLTLCDSLGRPLDETLRATSAHAHRAIRHRLS
jgi:hypothetical protein